MIVTKKSTIKQVQWFDNHFYKVEYIDKNGKTQTEYFPSTTTKLGVTSKPFLARWRGDIGNREADRRVAEAQEKGSHVHLAWDILVNKGVVIYNPLEYPVYSQQDIDEISKQHREALFIVIKYQDEMYDLTKLQKWHEEVEPEVIESETIVYSMKYKEAGQVDKIMYIKEGKYDINGAKPLELPEGLYVVDLKTGNWIDDDAEMQIADYAYMYEEMTGNSVIGGLVIHTGAKTKKGIEGLSTIYRTQEDLKNDFKKFRVIADAWQVKHGDMTPKVFEFPSLIKFDKGVIANGNA